jgi:fatty-acyl-CoA synthase
MTEPGRGDWALADLFTVVSDTAADRTSVVWVDRRDTYAGTRARVDGLAGCLVAHGIGGSGPDPAAPRWSCAQDRVAVLMHNRPEHLEALLGAWRARAVPFNVNYHYTAREVAALLRQMGARAVVYQRRLADRLRDVAEHLDLLVEVDDGSDGLSLAGAIAYDEAIATPVDPAELPTCEPDDRYLACTGGTTGRPKGVVWRQADIILAGMGGPPGTPDELRTRVENGGGVWFATSPLMHVAAQWTAMVALSSGATVVLHDDSEPFAIDTILETAARERVNFMTIVGDAYARPMVERLDRGDLDLSALVMIGTGGAPTSHDLKRAIRAHLPHVMIRDGYGATEIGAAAFGALADEDVQRFELGAGTRVLSADRTRFLTVDDTQVGWLARSTHVPLGYLDDPTATEALFPEVGGIRLAVPGDRARMEPDGRFVLLGRDSLVVNTGGEKVFVEEVEDALKHSTGVRDVVVVGRPSERFGQEVVAIVALAAGTEPDGARLRADCAERIARYKSPRAFLFVDRIQRHPSGKADYAWARARAADAAGVV